jgi:histone-lysine N-methyltransferase SETD3
MLHLLWIFHVILSHLIFSACAQEAASPGPQHLDPEEGVLAWLRRLGGTARGVEVAEFPGMGRGFIATRDIVEGDVVLEVPSKDIFMIKNALEILTLSNYFSDNVIFSLKNALRSDDLLHRRIARALSRDQEQVVAALLLLERARGGASAWAPYIKVLPEYVPNGASEGFLVAELQNPHLERDVNRSVAALQARFGPFQRALASEWPEALPLPELGDLRWAASIVDSRALRFQGQVNLIPVADIFNYRSHPVPRRKSGGDFFLSHHRLSEGEGLQVTADRRCKAGEQLFEDYGDNEDSIYLQYHGFVADENPFRCVDVQVGPPEDAQVPPGSSRRALLESLKLNTTLKKCLDASGEVGLGILVYLAVQGMSDPEAEKCLNVVVSNKNDWNTIFVKCNFIQVQAEVGKYLETVIPEVNRLLVDPPASVESDAQLASARELLAASGPSLRVLGQLRGLVEAAVNSLPSSLAQDRETLSSVNSQLGGLSSSDADGGERHELMKRALSLQYRIATKTHWKRLCCIYGASCCYDVSTSQSTNEIESAGDQRQLDSASAAVSELDVKLASFMEWFHAAGPATCKLRAAAIPGFRIGTVATSAISAKEEYLSVPTAIIMDAGKASGPASGVAPLIRALAEKFPKSKDAFHELLFFLIHEYFVLGPRSFFWPYLSLLPTPAEMPIPVMWGSDEDVAARLGPSNIAASVSSYRTSLRKLFDSISKIDIIKKFFEVGTERDVLTFDNYRWATAILDSRSIWWGGERHLVPLLDFVNCAQGPSAHVVHSTALDESEKFAVTLAGP